MSDCIFCKIVAGTLPCQRVFENDVALAFLDIHPLADGHTMIVPKQHHVLLEDVPAGDLAGLFAAVQAVIRGIRIATEAPATTVGINNGRASGQVVPHLHVHVVPRQEGDGGGHIHSIMDGASVHRDLEDMRAAIEAAIAK